MLKYVRGARIDDDGGGGDGDSNSKRNAQNNKQTEQWKRKTKNVREEKTIHNVFAIYVQKI